MPQPLVSDEGMGLVLVPGRLYAFLLPNGFAGKGIPIWSHPKRHTGDLQKDVLGHIAPDQPFIFANNELDAWGERRWCKVVYSDIIGYILFMPFGLHLLLKDVTPSE